MKISKIEKVIITKTQFEVGDMFLINNPKARGNEKICYIESIDSRKYNVKFLPNFTNDFLMLGNEDVDINNGTLKYLGKFTRNS